MDREIDSERYSATPAHKAIFQGVYSQLTDVSPGQNPQERAKGFMESIESGSKVHVAEREDIPLPELYSGIWGGMEGCLRRFNGSQREEEQRIASDIFSGLTNNINNLVANGGDPLTAKVFVGNLARYNSVGNHNYRAITTFPQEIPQDLLERNNIEYQTTREQLERSTEGRSLPVGGFVEVNSLQREGDVTTRVYITPDLTQSPAQVLTSWQAALERTGLANTICFKIPKNILNKRQEGIIVYLTDKNNEDDVARLFTTFSALCSPELLQAISMPSTVSIRRGISIAPELRDINQFLLYSGVEDLSMTLRGIKGVPEQVSYNSWLASTATLSFELAYNAAIKKGQSITTPQELKDSAEVYFKQIVELSGLNPNTMMPNTLGGKMPAWVNKLKNSSQVPLSIDVEGPKGKEPLATLASSKAQESSSARINSDMVTIRESPDQQILQNAERILEYTGEEVHLRLGRAEYEITIFSPSDMRKFMQRTNLSMKARGSKASIPLNSDGIYIISEKDFTDSDGRTGFVHVSPNEGALLGSDYFYKVFSSCPREDSINVRIALRGEKNGNDKKLIIRDASQRGTKITVGSNGS